MTFDPAAGPRPGDGAGAISTRVEARCAWCGTVEFALDDLRVHARPSAAGLAEFVCPSCRRLNVRRLEESDVTTLVEAGARPGGRAAPFELLERHEGPPITVDDVIDFHEAVSALDVALRGATSEAAPEPAPAHERDAA